MTTVPQAEYDEDEPFLAESPYTGKERKHTRLESVKRFLGPFLTGVIVSSILWAVPLIINRTSAVTNVTAPAAPVITSCGVSPDEARARGCHFQLWSYSWVPHNCFDADLHDDFIKLHDKEDWKYYRNNNSEVTAAATESSSFEVVSLNQVLLGEGDGLYSTWGQHYWHCAFYLRRFFRATGGITNRDRDAHHSVHCQAWLADPFALSCKPVIIHPPSNTEMMDPKSEYSQLQSQEADDETSEGETVYPDVSARPYKLTSLITLLLVYCACTTSLILAAVAFALTSPSGVFHHNAAQSRPFQIEAVFGRSWAHMSLDPKYDSLWEDVEGDSGSIIFNLTDPAQGNMGMSATIAMFHQLHCLSIFRNVLQEAHRGVDPGLDWNDHDHWPHCLDYMRKSILCAADGTIEQQPILPNGTIAPFIDGSQDIRHCGDNRRLIEQMKTYGKTVTTKPFP
ncbi:hypothetical protein CSIM01_13681 [Colletotrichum simmondsii]|uniref:Tat pathway signal sequence n=1 Tax=Colletotrichum simmondsii TaxID=703756 RepID=A0A135TL02_9PEZI|nr:hypothetical protein CSIM01_13681 [Colletotrichum simmondsii]